MSQPPNLFRQAVLAEVADRFAQIDAAQRRLETQVKNLADQTAKLEFNRLQRRIFELEQLLIGTAAARPPGAVRAVAALPTPAVAIILPTYNRAAFILEAIASVEAQSFPHWELIVVDDGSTDNTEAVLAPKLADPRIRYLRQEKSNAAAARNRGIAATGAPLIAYIDSDNLWYPDFLSRAVDCLATEPKVELVYGALATWSHDLNQSCILWKPFNRESLLSSNFIDTNVMMHRRDLVTRLGGWDETLRWLEDWDLVLRYSEHRSARALNVLAAYYRHADDQRVTNALPFWPAEIAIKRKWFPPRQPAERPRVLYMIREFPSLGESCAATEIAQMRDWGVHIEVWRATPGGSDPSTVPIHGGSFAEAVGAAHPNLIHIHGISLAATHEAELAAIGLPVTLRLHGVDLARENLTQESMVAWLAHPWTVGIYADPNRIAALGVSEAGLKPATTAFNSTLFKPTAKDRRLVVRTAAALLGKDLEIFFQAARQLPEFRFVLVINTDQSAANYRTELEELNKSLDSPVDLRTDLPREAVAALIAEAGIYLHTMHRPGTHPDAIPIGQPISIAEAMATGCHCLVRDEPVLERMVEDAGASYRDLDHLVALIRATTSWTDTQWTKIQHRASDLAYLHHADARVLQTMFNDWMKLAKIKDEAKA